MIRGQQLQKYGKQSAARLSQSEHFSEVVKALESDDHLSDDEKLRGLIPKYSFLALKGGGSRGFIHLGILILLERLRLRQNIAMVSGTSAGAIGALLISTGWSAKIVKHKLNDANLHELLHQEWIFTRAMNLFTKKGQHDAQKIYEWFEAVIEEVSGSKKTSFHEWHELVLKQHKETGHYPIKDLYIEAFNTSICMNEEFSHTSKYRSVPIVDALRATIAYPGKISPWKIGEDEFSDGGVQADCPVKLFETKQGIPNEEMLAIWMDSEDRLHYLANGTPLRSEKPQGFISHFYANIMGLYNLQLKGLANSPYKDKFMLCDTVGIDTLDFSDMDKKQQALVYAGFYGGLRFFLKKHPKYTSQFFSGELLEHLKEIDLPITWGDFNQHTMLVNFTQERDEPEAPEALHSDWVQLLPLFESLQLSDDEQPIIDKPAPEDADKHLDTTLNKPIASWWWRLLGY